MSRTPRNGFEELTCSVIARWRKEAELLRAHGADEAASTKERDAAELELVTRAFSLENITLKQAAEESGFSYSALEKMVRGGTIRNMGEKGGPRVRRSDLPKKIRRLATQANATEPDLASAILGLK